MVSPRPAFLRQARTASTETAPPRATLAGSDCVHQAASAIEFKQVMDRLLIVGGARSTADTRELLLQAEAQYVQYVRESGASIE